jgi:hypothetical protein
MPRSQRPFSLRQLLAGDDPPCGDARRALGLKMSNAGPGRFAERLSCCRAMCLDCAMDDETRAEFEFHVLAFCMAVPATFWLVRTIMAFVS